MSRAFLVACLVAAALVAQASARSGSRLLLQDAAEVDCFEDPSNAECASYTIPDDVLTANISILCTSMPNMDGCILQTNCENATFAATTDCSLFAIFQNLCEDMPRMNGCQGYNRLCASGTVVKQCLGEDEDEAETEASDSPAPAPAPQSDESEWVDPYAPLTGCYLTPTLASCADFEIPENVIDTNVTTLCTSMPEMTSCLTLASCQNGSISGDQCGMFSILAGVCLDMPRMTGCQGYNALCASGSVVKQCQTA